MYVCMYIYISILHKHSKMERLLINFKIVIILGSNGDWNEN